MSCFEASVIFSAMDKINKVDGVIHPRDKLIDDTELIEEGGLCPLELRHCTIYPVTDKNKFVHINDAGDIYESSVSSIRDARKIATWLMKWADWKGKKHGT